MNTEPLSGAGSEVQCQCTASSALDSLAPYKWIFIISTAMLLGYGFHAVYWKPRRTCAAGSQCNTCRSNRPVRIALWVATVLAVGGIAFEQVEPYLVR